MKIITREPPTTVVVLTNCKMVMLLDTVLKIQDRNAAFCKISVFLLLSPVTDSMRRILWQQDLGNTHFLVFSVLHSEGHH